MEAAVGVVQDKIGCLGTNLDIADRHAEDCRKQCGFQSGMVEQIVKQFAKYGEQYELSEDNERGLLQLQVVGDTPMHDMLRNSLAELKVLQAKKATIQAEQDEISGRLQGARRYLHALHLDQSTLQAGELGSVMRPNPLPLAHGGIDVDKDFGVMTSPTLCALCLERFPFWHAVICSCKHLYHPWCAGVCFRDNSNCASPDCGRVHPMWLKAFGFSSTYDEDRSGATRDDISASAAAEGGSIEYVRTLLPVGIDNYLRK